MSAERLQKLIAAAGIASRRKVETMIRAGRVTLNGDVVRELGLRADPAIDEIRVDGRRLPTAPPVYLALHKPPGVVTSVSDPHASRVVVDLLGPEIEARVFPAGRLDLESEGLVILTNDGELMHAMTRPGGDVDKVYRVEVAGQPQEADLVRLRAGLELGGRRLLPCVVELEHGGAVSRARVVLHEGKKKQIRRMFRTIGHPVRRLVRTRIGPVRLGELAPGEYRELSEPEIETLRELASGRGRRAG